MLTFKDCLDYCGLTEGEVKVIARRERMTEMDALAVAHSLLQSQEGKQMICNVLAEEMNAAGESNDEVRIRSIPAGERSQSLVMAA